MSPASTSDFRVVKCAGRWGFEGIGLVGEGSGRGLDQAGVWPRPGRGGFGRMVLGTHHGEALREAVGVVREDDDVFILGGGHGCGGSGEEAEAGVGWLAGSGWDGG